MAGPNAVRSMRAPRAKASERKAMVVTMSLGRAAQTRRRISEAQ